MTAVDRGGRGAAAAATSADPREHALDAGPVSSVHPSRRSTRNGWGRVRLARRELERQDRPVRQLERLVCKRGAGELGDQLDLVDRGRDLLTCRHDRDTGRRRRR